MSQYNDKVEQQRLKIEAEEWAKGVRSMHAHSLSSMWYDNRPQDTADGKGVVDIEFNDGSVKRTLSNEQVVMMGTQLRGQELIESYTKNSQ
jgi:hypothetical protein